MASGTWAMIAYHKRSDPATMFAKAEIDKLKQSGELGKLRYVRITMPPGDWIASGQFINAGDARDLEEGAGLLTFKRELRELDTRAAALAREVDAAATAAKDARTRYG